MKLTLSKSDDPRGKHLVIVAKPDEYAQIIGVLREEVSQGRRIPTENGRDGLKRMRFKLDYLERIMLCVPFAEISEGVQKMLFRAEMQRLLAIPVPELEIPGMVGDLWEPQRQAVGLLADERIELLNDDMGSGKTKTILATLALKNWFPALVAVGSVSGKFVWQAEAHRWFPDLVVQVVDGNAEQRAKQLAEEADIYLVNVQALRIKTERDKNTGMVHDAYVANPAIFEKDWEAFVCDEYHRLKNPSAQQTTGFLRVECGRFIGASGTPIMNRPNEAWSFLHKCDPERFPTFYHFEQQIGKFSDNGHLLGYKPDEMLKVRNWLAEHSLRRRKEHNVAILRAHGRDGDLPEVIHSDVVVPMTAEQRRIYNDIRQEMMLALDDGTSKAIVNVLAQILRLKQACFSPELFGGRAESGKINQIKEDVAMLIESGQKAIVFSQFAKGARILEREFKAMGIQLAYVDGSVKGDKRNAEVDRFNNDPECKLYVGTIQANQEAITLNAATYVLFADLEWTPAANNQAEARSAAGGMRGLGVTVPVNVIRYHAEETIEQRLAESLERKTALFNAMIERDGGRIVKRSIIATLRSII